MRRSTVFALLVLACGCTGSDAKGPEEALPGDGKADAAGRFLEHDSPIQEIGEIGVSLTSEIRAHAWTFHLGTEERVSLYTAFYSGSAHDEEVDTVLYLYAKEGTDWGHAIQRNDDASSETAFSRIDVVLEPGDYRIVVKGYASTTRGDFAVNLRCADGFCDYYDPNQQGDPDEFGRGEADPVGEGPVSFRVPILDENGDGFLSRFNAALAAAGLPTFPDYITVSSDDADADAQFDRIQEQADREDVLAITLASVMAYSDPGSLVSSDPEHSGLCYSGDATALADFLSGFSDSIFSDQFSLYGWRAGSRSAYDEWHEPTTSSNIYAEWQAYDPSQDGVLIVFSTDDDGTETVAEVPACQD